MLNEATGKYEVIFTEEKDDTAHVRVLEGKFKDFVYKYGTVSVSEEEDTANLSYDYTLLEVPAEYTYEDEAAEQEEFENFIGDVLYDIIVNSDNIKEATDGN